MEENGAVVVDGFERQAASLFSPGPSLSCCHFWNSDIASPESRLHSATSVFKIQKYCLAFSKRLFYYLHYYSFRWRGWAEHGTVFITTI